MTPWTVSHQDPLSVKFSRQEYWSGLPFPSPGDLPDPGIEPGSPALAGVKEKELAPSCLIMVMLIKIVMTVQSGSQVVEGVSSGVKEPRFES